MQPKVNSYLKIRRNVFNVALALLLFLAGGALIKNIQLKGDTNVKIEIELKNHADDVFHLYYLPVSETSYSDQRFLVNTLKGSAGFQKTAYSLPDSLQIKQLRFDLGANSKQQQIMIKSIILIYNDEKLVLFNSHADINYFSTNEFANNEGKGLFTLNKPVNENYDPVIYSKDLQTEYLTLLRTRKHIPFPYLIAFVLVLALYIYMIAYAPRVEFMTSFYAFASCFFLLLLFLPLIDETFELTQKTNAEKRKLAQKPFMSSGNFLDYPKQFEQYYNDNFGFRSFLIGLGGKIKYYCFHTSIVPESAQVGKEGWMFLNGKRDGVTRDLTKENLYTEKALKETIAEWEGRKRTLARDSIAYYRCFWPDKHCIYPEYLPFCMKIINKDTISRCDQALKYLKDKGSDLKLIDVRIALFKEKEKNQIYQKYDSHWNSSGAFVGYTGLMNSIAHDFPALKSHPVSDFNVTWNYEGGGDLAGMLGITATELMPSYVLKKSSVKITRMPAAGFPEQTQIYENEGAATDLTLLIYRDSFSSHVMPFLNLHFRKVIALWNVPYSEDMAKKVGADLVIETYASRFF